MKKTMLTLLLVVLVFSVFGCKKQSLLGSLLKGKRTETNSLLGTYATWDEDTQVGQIVIFGKDTFRTLYVMNDFLQTYVFSYRKDGDTYFAKLLEHFDGNRWNEDNSEEEEFSVEQVMDDIIMVGELTFTNWESLYGDIAEGFDQGIESFFEGDWTDYFSTGGRDDNVMTFSGKNYSTSSGFQGTFSFKGNKLYFGNFGGTTTYILDENHFVSIPDTDGDVICDIYERFEEID